MPEIIVKRGDNIVNKYFLCKDLISIGRSHENEIVIENLAVSRIHATIVHLGKGQYQIEDRGSSNGTFVNGVRIDTSEIFDKDVISIGKHKLYFYDNMNQRRAPDPTQKTMLVAPVDMMALAEAPQIPRLRIIKGRDEGAIFRIKKVETRLGRAADNDIRVYDWFVSKHHALLLRRGSKFIIRDLASWRHTYVNGAIVDEQLLSPGDTIQLGPKVKIAFEVEEDQRLCITPDQAPSESSQSALPGPEEANLPLDGPLSDERMSEGSSIHEIDIDINEPLEEDVGVEMAPSLDSVDQNDTADENMENVQSDESDSEPETPDPYFDPDPSLQGPSAPPKSSDVNYFEFASEEENLPEQALDETADNGQDDDAGCVNETECPEVEAAGLEDEQGCEQSDAVLESVAETAIETARDVTDEVALWLRALENSSAIIRKQAKRKLKTLTGRDYAIEE